MLAAVVAARLGRCQKTLPCGVRNARTPETDAFIGTVRFHFVLFLTGELMTFITCFALSPPL